MHVSFSVRTILHFNLISDKLCLLLLERINAALVPGPRPQGFSFRKCEGPGEEVEEKQGRTRSWAMSCQVLPGPCMGFSPVFTVTNSRGTPDSVAWNKEACLMRYGIKHKSKLAQLENLSGLFRWTPPLMAF